MVTDNGSSWQRSNFHGLVVLLLAILSSAAAIRPARADAISDWENTYAPPPPTNDRQEDALDARRKLDSRLANWEHRDLRRSREMQAKAQQLQVLEEDMARTRANLNDANQRMQYWAGKVKERRQNEEPGWFSYWFSTPADRKELNDATHDYDKYRNELDRDARHIASLEHQLGDVQRFARGQVAEAGSFQRDVYYRSAPLMRSPAMADRDYGWGARMQAGYAYQRARDLSVDANFLVKDMGTLEMQYRLSQSQLNYLQDSIGRRLDRSILGGYIRRQVQQDVDAGCDLRQTRCSIKGFQGFDNPLAGAKGGSCDDQQPPPFQDPSQYQSFGKGGGSQEPIFNPKGGGSEGSVFNPKGGGSEGQVFNPKDGKGYSQFDSLPPLEPPAREPGPAPVPPRAPASDGLALPVAPDSPPDLSGIRGTARIRNESNGA